MLRDRFFLVLFGVLCAVTVLHVVGTVFFLYWRFGWLDIVTHLMGGFWAGGSVLWIFDKFGFGQTRSVFCVLLAVLAGFTIGAWWEIFEVLIGSTHVGIKDYVPDTIADFIFDMTGSLFAGLYFLKIKHKFF